MDIAIVTGASSGIGKEFVKQLSTSNHLDEIWMIARREERLNALAKKMPTKLKAIELDLLSVECMEQLKERLEKEKPEIKVLVNSSGFGKFGKFNDLTKEEINNMIDLNCKALIHMTYLCLNYMKKGSKIIMMGSASSFFPLPEFNLYATTKAFVVHFSRALHVELKNQGITVTTVCPGYVRTEFFKVAKNTKNPNTCKNFKPMYESKDIVKKALRDSQRGKDMSVYGFLIKMLRLLSKMLPHRFIMWIWLRIK